MHRLMAMMMLLVWAQTFAGLRRSAAQNGPKEVRELLRDRIEAAGIPPKMTMGEESIHATATLPRFYERRAYQPAWIGNEGPLPQADALVRTIHEADREGLRPTDYHLTKIEALVRQIGQDEREKRRVNPETFDPEWHANRREADLPAVLQAALETNIEQTVPILEPIPVHLLYWTDWVDEEESVQFRDDIYGRDELLDRALREKPPGG